MNGAAQMAANGFFQFEEEDWQAVAATASLPATWDQRHELERFLTEWLVAPTTVEARQSIASNDKVAAAAQALLDAIETTGSDFFLEDGQSLADVVSGVVAGWDDWKWELRRNGDDAGREPLRYALCRLWRVRWRRELASSVDPATGVPGGPLVRFLVTVHGLVEGHLDPEHARYAIRKMAREIPDPATDEELAAELAAGQAALDELVGNGERED